MNKPHKFFYVLDGIRGIASLLVVLRHAAQFFGPIDFQESYLAVDIFFLLSGVVIGNAYEERLKSGMTAIQFAKVRLIRIYPLYFLGSFLTLIALMLGLIPHIAYLPLTILLALFVIPSPIMSTGTFALDGPAWSLYLELVGNFFYGWIVRRLTGRVIASIMLLSALGLIATLYLRQHLNVGSSHNGHIVGYFRVGYSFFAGVALYRRYASFPHRERESSAASWILLAAVAALLVAAPSGIFRPYYDFLAVTFVFPMLIYMALWIQPDKVTARICVFFGAVSYAVYALHYPLSMLISGLVGNQAVESRAPLSGVLFLVFLVAFCWLIDKIYDGPVRKHLSSKKPDRAGSAAHVRTLAPEEL